MTRTRATELGDRPRHPREQCPTCRPNLPGRVREDRVWAWSLANGRDPWGRRG